MIRPTTPNDTVTLIALTEAIDFEPHHTQTIAQMLTAYFERASTSG